MTPTQQAEKDLADLLGNDYKEAATVLQDEHETDKPVEQPDPAINSEQTTTNVNQPVDIEAPFGRFENGKPRKTPKKGIGSTPVVNHQTSNAITEQTAQISGVLIDGALFILLVDMILPICFALINNYFSESKVEPDLLKLTDEQKKEITPLIDKVMKSLTVRGNPYVLLFFTLFVAYGSNFMMAKLSLGEPKKK